MVATQCPKVAAVLELLNYALRQKKPTPARNRGTGQGRNKGRSTAKRTSFVDSFISTQ